MLGAVNAQDLNTRMTQANTAWGEGKYQECHQLFENIVKTYGPRAPLLYGPKFGLIHYRQGLCELKLADISKRANKKEESMKWFDKAAKSFEICYTKYPNGAKGMAPTNNTSHKAALQRWAESSMGQTKYEEAIKLYGKFIKERDASRDKILPSPGGFNINLAICHFLSAKPQIPKGIEHFETAIVNKVRMRTQDAGIVAAFLALSQVVIAEKNENAMVDFLNKNRAAITLKPYQMHEYTPVFLKLASNALEAEMFIAAFNLYALIPDTDEAIQDIKVRMDQLANRRGIKDGNTVIELARLKKGMDKLRAKQRSGDPDDLQVLSAMAYLQDRAGNQRGVYGALEQMELFFKKSTKRETNLFNLVRVSSLIGEILSTEHYGSIFLKDFPESDKVEDVRRLMLSSLFFGGEHKKSLEVAKVLIDKVQKGTKQHDICVFVLGGSHFYLGNFDEAQPFLDQHVEEYPKSDFIMHSEYFQGSNLTRLQYWEKAATLLDAFLAKYKNPNINIYMPNALYDRANCHFSESEYDPALVQLNRIESEFVQSAVTDTAYNMKGNIFESTGKREDAEEYYLKALEVSENRNNKLVAGEALSNIIGMLGAEKIDKKPNPRIKDAVPFYEKFMKEYSNSPYKPQAVVYGMVPMRAVGREVEALENLQGMITQLAGQKNQAFLEECVNAYSDAFLQIKGNTPAKLKTKYYNFPGIDLGDKRTLALLRIALIGVFEGQLKTAEKDKNEDLTIRYEADIKILFNDLKGQFQPKELTNFVLIRVGDYLREKTSAPKQALSYYDELLTRKDKTGMEFKALLGIADVMGSSDAPSDNKKAIASLERVHSAANDDPVSQEKALFRIVEINDKLGDWEAVSTKARQYLDEKHSKKAAEVSYLYAKSFDKRGKLEDALANYGLVYARYTGFIAISAPSVKRVMEIMWDRGLNEGDKVGAGDKAITLDKSDRQSAYEDIGSKYISSTTRIRQTNKNITDEEIKLWDKVAALVKEYETSGQVKTLAEIKKEDDR